MIKSKKLLAVILSLVMLLSALPLAGIGAFAEAPAYPDGFSLTEQLENVEWRLILANVNGGEEAYLLSFGEDGTVSLTGTPNSADYTYNTFSGTYNYTESTETCSSFGETEYTAKVVKFGNFTVYDFGFDKYESEYPCDMYRVQLAEANGAKRNGVIIDNSVIDYKDSSFKESLGDSNWRIDPLYKQGARYYSFRKNRSTAWLDNTRFTDEYSIVSLSANIGMLKTLSGKGIDFVIYERVAPGLMLSVLIFKSGSASYQYMYRAFPDVNPDAWYYDAVTFNAMAGLLSGYQNGNFGPADSLKRQDFVVILSKIAEVDTSEYAGAESAFTDVDPSAYYAAAVNWAVETGIIKGYENGKFGVGDNITREQICTILYRMFGSPEITIDSIKGLLKYTDTNQISSFAIDAVAWAIENGVISGMADGKLAPTATASRAQIAVIIENLLLSDLAFPEQHDTPDDPENPDNPDNPDNPGNPDDITPIDPENPDFDDDQAAVIDWTQGN